MRQVRRPGSNKCEKTNMRCEILQRKWEVVSGFRQNDVIVFESGKTGTTHSLGGCIEALMVSAAKVQKNS